MSGSPGNTNSNLREQTLDLIAAAGVGVCLAVVVASCIGLIATGKATQCLEWAKVGENVCTEVDDKVWHCEPSLVCIEWEK
jgi:ABC-type phosphate/phosphonate transport system permease subunit